MDSRPSPASPFDAWLAALDERHLADFTAGGSGPRVAGAVVLLRRTALPAGRGRRARNRRQARGLCPLLRPPPLPDRRPRRQRAALRRRRLLKCWIWGAGPAPPAPRGRCQCAAGRITGFDRHPWAVAEANWTYRVLGLHGRAHRQDLSRVRLEPAPGLGILAAYTINELPDDLRSAWLTRLLDARARGATVLIIEPIARRMAPWWRGWEDRVRRRRRAVRRMAVRCPAARAAAAAGPNPPASIRASCGRGACSRDRIAL